MGKTVRVELSDGTSVMGRVASTGEVSLTEEQVTAIKEKGLTLARYRILTWNTFGTVAYLTTDRRFGNPI